MNLVQSKKSNEEEKDTQWEKKKKPADGAVTGTGPSTLRCLPSECCAVAKPSLDMDFMPHMMS